MSPQLFWTIAGLVLTILTLGGVTISSYQSMDGSTAKLIASETGNIATATKLWIGSKSTDNTFNGITAETVGSLIPDLKVTGTGAASRLGSKAAVVLFASSTRRAGGPFHQPMWGAPMTFGIANRLSVNEVC